MGVAPAMPPPAAPKMEITEMIPSKRYANAALLLRDASANEDSANGESAVQLGAQKAIEVRVNETLHVAMQLVSRLCDRGISERERTDCALRARGSLRSLEQMLAESPRAPTAAPVLRRVPVAPREDS
jgi:hypothetical protein